MSFRFENHIDHIHQHEECPQCHAPGISHKKGFDDYKPCNFLICRACGYRKQLDTISSYEKPGCGDLAVWWIPQVPMEPFIVRVSSLQEAKLILNVLGRYDVFQLERNIKPDYSNAGGLNIFDIDPDGSGKPDWTTWYHPLSGEDIDEYKSEGGTPK